MDPPDKVPWLVIVGLLGLALAAGVQVKHFHCPGNQEVAVINNKTGQTLQSICGSDADISFTAGSQGADLSISFVGFGSNMPIELYRKTFYGTLEPWSVLPATLDTSYLPCGTGQLVASVDDNVLGKSSFSERVAVVCNNSDVNVKLVVERDDMTTTGYYYTGSSTPTLKADGMTNVLDQLRYSGQGIRRVYLANSIELPSVTNDVPHTVMMYLRDRYMPRRHIKNCNTADFSILDEIIASYNFTTKMSGYEEVTNYMNGIISTESKVCGDAELVIMFDALHTDLDNDTCDNFETREVYVDCSYKMNHDDKCLYVPHESHGGTELLVTRGTHDVFVHKFWDNKWEENSKHSISSDSLMGLSRFYLLSHIMQNIPMQDEGGLCQVKEPFSDIDFDTRYANQPHVPPDPTLSWRFTSLKDRIKGYTGNYSLWYDIDSLRQEADMDMDESTKMYKYGAAYGLNSSLNYQYHKQMYQNYGMSMPSNMTRLYLGSHLWHAGIMAQRLFSMDTIWGSREAAVTAQAMVYGSLHLLDMMEDDLQTNTSHHVRSVLNTVSEKISEKMNPSTTMSPSMSSCPHEKRVLPEAEALLFLGAGHDGKMETHMNDGEMCRQKFMYNYFRRGGARVHARDFPEMVPKTDQKLDDICKRHPVLGPGGPYVMWKMDDKGRIMKGLYSPLSRAVAWKPVATCRCDSCHGYYDYGYYGRTTSYPGMGYGHSTSPWYWHHQSTTPYNYMGYTTTYPHMGK